MHIKFFDSCYLTASLLLRGSNRLRRRLLDDAFTSRNSAGLDDLGIEIQRRDFISENSENHVRRNREQSPKIQPFSTE